MPTDSTEALPTRNGGARFSNPSSITNYVVGMKTVTQAGTTMSNASLRSGVRLKADAANAETVFVGNTSAVTSDTGGNLTNTGYKLNANEELFIDIDSMNKVFVMSAGGGETLSFIAS